jgi:hypothetical protein
VSRHDAGRQGPAEEVAALLCEPGASSSEIARFFDGLAHADRVSAIRSLGRAQQSALWDKSEGFAEVGLIDLVPPETPVDGTVRHYGKNTLPFFSHFEKRFARQTGVDADDPRELIGFNFQTMAPLTGPGYFVAVPSEKAGEVLVDYRRVPKAHPPGWPDVKSNERGLSRLVYGFMVDTLRRVSEHVTIGSAARNGKDLGSWFILCREST